MANQQGGRGPALAAANTVLLIASLLFYAWGEIYLVWVMVGSCALNYVGGILCVPGRRGRRAALIAAVAANLGVLAWFKYSGLAVDAINRANTALGHLFGGDIKWAGVALPLGISFYTFHGISYVVDVWRGKVAASRNFRDFLCYSSLFPQLVAGPIVRYSEVAEFLTCRRVTLAALGEGAHRFVIGLGKKALIANQVAGLADAVFALPIEQRSPGVAWVGAIAYALQIYYDFSGYSDMAVGLGQMLGFRFPENFNYPYIAGSVREFWRRWHMTLSRFFRDYLYIPLGGNRHGAVRTAFNLLAVFALCGLWHGASWNFIFWGLFHGFFLALERVIEPLAPRIPGALRPFGHVYTLVVVLVSWVLFRCDSWPQATGYLQSMVGMGGQGGGIALPPQAASWGVVYAGLAGIVFSIPIIPALRGWLNRRALLGTLGRPIELGFAWTILSLSLLAIGAGSHNPFIYYRF
jgi:alginate O-acetyltransferase complex protein AlgI